MTKTKWAVKLGGKLYVAAKYFGLSQTTTQDIFNACFFTSEEQAERVAQRCGTIFKKGEVVQVTVSDEDINSEYNSLVEEYNRLADEYNKVLEENRELRKELEEKR